MCHQLICLRCHRLVMFGESYDTQVCDDADKTKKIGVGVEKL